MRAVCQVLILLIGVAGFFATLRADFHGRKATEPYGFRGAVITIILYGVGLAIYIRAGAFSEIVNWLGVK